MLYGKVVRPSTFNAKLASFDSKEAETAPNVKVVRDGDFIGVVAPDAELAANAVDLIKAQWNAPPQIAEAALFESLRETASSESRGGFGGGNRQTGSVEIAMASAAKTLSATYTVAYIQHVPLEPRAAVA